MKFPLKSFRVAGVSDLVSTGLPNNAAQLSLPEGVEMSAEATGFITDPVMLYLFSLDFIVGVIKSRKTGQESEWVIPSAVVTAAR